MISTPILIEPLNHDGRAVAVTGHTAGARIFLYKYRIGSTSFDLTAGPIEAPYERILDLRLAEELVSGERVFSIQEVGGERSRELAPSEAVLVGDPIEKLELVELGDAFACGRSVGFSNVANGATVVVQVKRVGEPDFKTYWAFPNGTSQGTASIWPPFKEDEAIRAYQTLGDAETDMTPPPTPILKYPGRLPKPTIEPPLIECAPSFIVKGTVTGATVNIYRSGETEPLVSVVAGGAVTDVEFPATAELPNGLTDGMALEADQVLCGVDDRSERSPVETVLPQAAIGDQPLRIQRPALNAAGQVRVLGVHESLIQIYDAADATHTPLGGATCFGATWISVEVPDRTQHLFAEQTLTCPDTGHVEGSPPSREASIVEDPLARPLTFEEINELLRRHNEVRRDWGVMVDLVWSDEAAETAQGWAETLAKRNETFSELGEFAHSLPGVENLFMTEGGISTPSEVVDSWASESDAYKAAGYPEVPDPALRGMSPDPDYRHFTQIVWSDTLRLGGGRARTADGIREYWVCTYDPDGNSGGKPGIVERP